MDEVGTGPIDSENPDLAADDPGAMVDSENLVPALEKTEEGRKWLKERAASMVRLVKGDIDARQEWMEQREQQIKLFAGVVGNMKYPAEGGRAPHDPIICRIILQIWTRGCEQLWPAKGNLIQVSPVGVEDEEVAARREQHMNWQLRHKVPNWVEGHKETLLQFLLSGSAFRENSYDPVLATTKFDHLTADDIVVPYSRKDVDPRMRRVPRVTRILRLFRWELEDLRDAGGLANVDKLLSKDNARPSSEDDSALEEQAQEIDGVHRQTSVAASEDIDNQQRVLYRCHQWMKPPGEDRMRPMTFVVDAATNIVCSLKYREREDSLDRARFDADMKVWQAEMANVKAQYQAALQRHAQMTAQMPGIELPQPTPPQMPQQPTPVKMVPAYRVLHYRLFPNPHGFYGLGIAYLLANANELVNALEGEYLNAARFSNMITGLLPKSAMPKRGEIRLAMGKFIGVDLEPEQMGAVREFKFSPPSDALRKVIEGLKEDANTLIADADTLTGQAGPTNETKAAAQQRMSNATTITSAVTALYVATMAEEPKMLAEDNKLYMDEREPFWVTTPDKTKPTLPGEPPVERREQKMAMREDYASEFDFTFTADQRVQSQPERVQTAINVIDRLMNSPYVNDPAKGPILFHLAFTKLFQALDMPEMVKGLGPVPAPPVAPTAPTPMSQPDEIAMFLKDQDHPVLPTDNHAEHLMDINDFKESPYFLQMSSTGKQLLDAHERGHTAAAYQANANAVYGDQNGQGMGAQGGNPGMVGGPGNNIPTGPPAGPAVGPASAPGLPV